MSSRFAAALLLLVAAPSAGTADSAARPRLIPTSEFAISPIFQRPVLSPDGMNLLAKMDAKNKLQILTVYHLADGKMQHVGLPEKQDLRWYRWAGPNRILISVAQTVPWDGDEASMTRLFAYDLTSKKFTVLGGREQGLEGDDLLYLDPSGDWGLLSFQRTVYDYPSVFRVDLATNKLQEIVKQRSDVWEWYADGDGVVRAGIGFEDRTWSMVYRRSADESFKRLVVKAKYGDEEAAMELLGFARDSDEGYMLSNRETGRYALYHYNFATKQRGETVLESATNDISSYEFKIDGMRLISARYTDDRDRIVWYDPDLKAHQEALDDAVKDRENWIASRSKDNKMMLVLSGASFDPGRYYIYQPEAG